MRRVVPALLALMALAAVQREASAATTNWWDTSYDYRQNIAVATGPNAPDKGYNGYTARVATFDTATLISAGKMQAGCADLRVLYWDGTGWTELARHLFGCNTATTDIRFSLQADIPVSSTDDNYYIYYGNPGVGAPPAVTPTNVYLWYDDASVDRGGSYVRGRVDNWHGSGWDNSLAWNPAGYYTYDTGDNFTSGYRRAVDERDVYVEASFYHTGCYRQNITTGVLARGIILSGSLGSEVSNHYYATNRGEFPNGGTPCNSGGYAHDGDIMKTNRGVTAVNGANPGDVVRDQWRTQALAAFVINPTNLRFWDEDDSANWAALGWPNAGNLHVSGTDASDYEGRGFAAVMTAQDRARLRDVLIRRYIEPEPALGLGPEEAGVALVLQKTVVTVDDPFNGSSNPLAIPGANVRYTITTTNQGPGAVDSDTVLITEPLPSDLELFVNDLGAPGSGPVLFADGAPPSGLTYTFGGLGDPADDLMFDDGSLTYTYTPVPDVDGYDANVTAIRVNPKGILNGSGVGGDPSFELRLRMRVR